MGASCVRGKRRDAAADGLADLAELPHEVGELVGEERLRPVTEGPVRVGMDLDDDTVGAGGHGGPCHWRHPIADPRAVARIGDDGEVRQFLHRGNAVEVEHVARGGVLELNPHSLNQLIIF